MEHFYTIHPALKRNKSISEIKKLLEKLEICNILLKSDLFQNEKWSDQIAAKVKELKESGYSQYMLEIPGGDLLLLFTCDSNSSVYMPESSMMYLDPPDICVAQCKIDGCDRPAKAKSCKLCVDCCIQRNCKRSGSNGEEICKPHSATNNNRIKMNKKLQEEETIRTSGTVVRKSKKKRTQKATCIRQDAVRKAADKSGTRRKSSDDTVPTNVQKKKRKEMYNGEEGQCIPLIYWIPLL